MVKKQNSSKPQIAVALLVKNRRLITSLIILVVLVLALGFWYSRVYLSPTRVFYGMLADNLTTTSITREVNQPVCLPTAGNSSNIIQITYSPKLQAHCITYIKDNSTNPPVNVLAESLGTRQNDYKRYESVQSSGKDLTKYADVYKIWINNTSQTGSQQLLIRSLFNPLLFGDIAQPERSKILDQLNKSYVIDYKRIEKSHFSGRLTYGYNVIVKLDKFSEAWNAYASYYGFGSGYLLKAGTYMADSKLALNIQVDAVSHQVKSVNFQGASELYAGYGLSNPKPLPTKIYTPEQLQNALNKVK